MYRAVLPACACVLALSFLVMDLLWLQVVAAVRASPPSFSVRWCVRLPSDGRPAVPSWLRSLLAAGMLDVHGGLDVLLVLGFRAGVPLV